MEFEQKKPKKRNEENYHLENMKLARDFSKGLLNEMNETVRSIVLFGSNTNDTLDKESDIDVMVVLDNVSVYVSDELREAYRIITNKLNSDTGNNKIHLMTVNLTDLWDMARKGDPVLINVLRYGLPIFDRDLVEPMQYLLEIGRIKPTRESVYNYMARSETLLNETKRHLLDSILDIYYSLIDMVHASLMIKQITPPSPRDMPKLFKKEFKGTDMEKYSETIEEFYQIAKDIERKRYSDIDGKDYDKLHKKGKAIIEDLRKFNNKELKKKDIFEF